MIIKGLVGDNLASMSFNEHHYVLKKVAMSFSTLYYLGLNPSFANYIAENDTLVVSGKLSKRDLIEEEATIYSGITITKDKEYINVTDIKDNTKYLKNIDVKTGECFSRLYIDGDITEVNNNLYSYNNDNSLVLVTPNLDKKDFNIYDLKKVLTMINHNDSFNMFNVKTVNHNEPNNYYEVIIKVGDIDTIHVPFTLDNKNNLNFYSFVYSERFYSEYKLKSDDSLISFEFFSYYFSKCKLIMLLNDLVNQNKMRRRKDFDRARIYVMPVNKVVEHRK